LNTKMLSKIKKIYKSNVPQEAHSYTWEFGSFNQNHYRTGASSVVATTIQKSQSNNDEQSNSNNESVTFVSELLIVGGSDEKGNITNTILRYDLDHSTWKEPISDNVFPARELFGLVFIPSFPWNQVREDLNVGRGLLAFGGKSNGYRNDLWAFNIEHQTWHKIEPKGKLPDPRYGHTATLLGNRMYIFGGYDNNASACNDLWEFSLDNFAWTKVEIASERPPSRFSHVAALLEESVLVIHGGLGDKGEARDDLWAFKFATKTWEQIEVKGSKPASRYGHACYTLNGKLVIFGGFNKKEKLLYQDLQLLDLENKAWVNISASGTAPGPRYYSTLAVDYLRILVFGGRDDNRVFNDLHICTLNYSYFDFVPKDVCLKIFQHFTDDPYALAKLSRVSKKFYSVVDEDVLWVPIAARKGVTVPQIEARENLSVRKWLITKYFLILLASNMSPFVWRNPAWWGQDAAALVNNKKKK